MPFIPEETIDQLLDEVRDMKDAVQIQTQAVRHLDDVLRVHGQYLVKIHDAVTKKPAGDSLGDLIRTLIAADKQHAEILQQILAAVSRQR